MILEELTLKYITSAESVLKELKLKRSSLNVNVEDVLKIVESARAYLKDAKYYRERKKFEVSLTSVAYCEGLLDALRMLGAVEFEWPKVKGREKSEK